MLDCTKRGVLRKQIVFVFSCISSGTHDVPAATLCWCFGALCFRCVSVVRVVETFLFPTRASVYPFWKSQFSSVLCVSWWGFFLRLVRSGVCKARVFNVTNCSVVEHDLFTRDRQQKSLRRFSGGKGWMQCFFFLSSFFCVCVLLSKPVRGRTHLEEEDALSKATENVYRSN